MSYVSTPTPFFLVVRISAIKAVYDDGTIAFSNATSAARRLLLRKQIGVQVNYYVTTTQSQALTMALLTQNTTRAAMATVLRISVPGAELSFPRFGDTVPPSFAPTPVPTVKADVLSYSAIVGVSVTGSLICLIGSIVLGFYSWRWKRKQDATPKTKTPTTTMVRGANNEVGRFHNFSMPPSPLVPGRMMDLEGGDHHDVFQRPRLFHDYHVEDDDEKEDDDMDKDSDLSSIAMSVTEVLTTMISSVPSSGLLLPGHTGLGQRPLHGTPSGLFREGDSPNARNSPQTQVLSITEEKDDLLPVNDVDVSEMLNVSEQLLIAKTVDRVLWFKESEKTHHITTTTTTNNNTNNNHTTATTTHPFQHRSSLPLPPPRVRSRQSSIAPPAPTTATAGDGMPMPTPSYGVPPSTGVPMGTIPIPGFSSSAYHRNPLFRRGSKAGPSQTSLLLSSEPQLRQHDSPDKDQEDGEGKKEDGGVWDDVSSVIHGDLQEHGDLYLSAAYQQSGWEDGQDMILSTNPAWVKLLDEEEEEPDHHRRLSFVSGNSSQNLGSGDSNKGEELQEEARSRPRSFMTIDSTGGSDIVAVKAGG